MWFRGRSGVSLLAALAAILTFSYSCDIVADLQQTLPEDRKMEQVFRERRGEFLMVLEMFNVDGNLTRITNDFTWVSGKGLSSDTGDPGISTERWAEYRGLFRRLGLSGLTRGSDQSVWFVTFSRGLGVSGLSKGYLYTRSDPKCENQSLDSPKPFNGKRFLCKALFDDWYIYLSD